MAEDPKERVDRELIELLNELRVVLPGAQVLFAFLLTLPFTTRVDLSDLQRNAYFVAFICAAIGIALLMAPTTHHRLRFREGEKERMLLRFNKLAIAGTAFLAAAMSLSIFVVTDVLFDRVWAAVIAGFMAAWFVGVWYVLPLVRLPRER